MDLNEKFFYLTGEVDKRIHNPEQTSKDGRKYRINYLVLKWVSGRQGTYVDYVKIKVLKAKRMAEIRAGFIVKVPVRYSCLIGKNKTEVEYRFRNINGTTVEEPNLWPEFILDDTREIEIINQNVNFLD